VPDHRRGLCLRGFRKRRTSFIGWPDLTTCPGLVTVADPPPPDPAQMPNGWNRVYRAGALRIEYGMHCLRCAGPAPSHFSISFDRPRRRGE
jgi:hypothetical protein